MSIRGFLIVNLVTAFCSLRASAQMSNPTVPAEIADQVERELGSQECLKSVNALKTGVGVINLELHRDPTLALLAFRYECMAATDQKRVISARLDGGWRMILNFGGDLRVLRSSTNGWSNLETWEHHDPEVRRIYHFRGNAYQEVSCDVVILANSSIKHPKVTYHPCKRVPPTADLK